MREFSIPALAQIPATANLADVVFRRAAEQPQAVVLRRPSGAAGDSGAWTDVTASQFSAEVTALAKGLVAAGIEPGDRVALMSHTRYEWTLIDYAIWTAGAVTVPVYETSSAEQAEWILSDSGARACFVETASYGDIIGSFRDRVPALSHVWRIDSDLDSLRALTQPKLVLLSRDTWFGEMPCANSAFRPWRRFPRPRTSPMSCSAGPPSNPRPWCYDALPGLPVIQGLGPT